jgi:hypothetical protein
MSIDERGGQIIDTVGHICDGCLKTFTDGGYRLGSLEPGASYRPKFACDDSCLAEVKERFGDDLDAVAL